MRRIRRRLSRPSLFARIYPIHLGIVAAALLLVAGTALVTYARADDSRIVARLATIARIVAAGLPDDADGAQEYLSGIIGAASLDSIDVFASDGSLTYGVPTGAHSRTLGRRTDSGIVRLDTTRYAYAVEPLSADGARPGIERVRVVERLDLGPSRRGRAILTVLTALTLTLCAAAAILFRYLRWIDQPISAIRSTARHLARGELNVRVRAQGPAELLALAADIDEMANQLRRRIADISHQRNQLEAILSSMLEGVVVLDGSQTIVSLNDAAGRLLSVSPPSATGRTLLDALRNAQLDEVAREALTGDQPVERTITLYRERPLHVQVHATALEPNGASPRGSLIVLNDITRLVQLEALRREFVANVSHELRTPITSIKGFVETLLDDETADREEQRRFLGIVLHHTNRLNAIIEDLLSLSRLEQPDQQLRFERFAIATVVESAIEACSSRIAEKRIPIEREVTDGYAWGNPSLIEQALINLIDNAVKYSAAGSPVSVAVSRRDASLVIQVRDRGAGIPARDLPRVFERFYRTDRARSRELGGTGLGLAIVKHIALAHHGRVDVESVYAEGSTFTIEIPQTAAPEGEPDAPT
ncbi:MAG: PAS domain-containing protein [Spirochaetaceae bacterium]|nr:MAG: PAS domain-containing protein [Spirochaetaceae bacterium]